MSLQESAPLLALFFQEILPAGIAKIGDMARGAVDMVRDAGSSIVQAGRDMVSSVSAPSLTPDAPVVVERVGHGLGQAIEVPSMPNLSSSAMTQVQAISRNCPVIDMSPSSCSLSNLGTGLEAPTFAINHGFHQQQQAAGHGLG